jgi:tetrapyrrole methylase family protein/MazG family protein
MGIGMEFTRREQYGIEDLLAIVALLRSPEGCPWDREQTHTSIRRNFIEETYEAVDAIDEADTELLREELGDVLLQVLFHTQIEAEQNAFTFADVCDGVCKKMILRHPHIFGGVKADTSGEVLKNWDEIKAKEKRQETRADALKSIPAALPALIRADKLQSKAAKSGFFKRDVQEALADLQDEIAELAEAMAQNNKDEITHELGDILFAAANLARHLEVDPESALTQASDRFISRFDLAEQAARHGGILMEDADEATLIHLWKEAKNMEAKNIGGIHQ